VSDTPRDGAGGWLRYEGDEPDPTQADVGAPDQPDPQGPTSDSAWLRHDLPDPSAADTNGSRPAGQAPDSVWLPPEVDVARPAPTPDESHDTGVPPTIVVEAEAEAEDSTPSHLTGQTQPMPDDLAPAPHTSAAADLSDASGSSVAASAANLAEQRDAAEGDAAERDAAERDAAERDAAERDATTGKGSGRDDDEQVSGLAVLGAAVKEFAIVVGMALVLSFIVKTWLLQAFYIPSGSMEDTLVLNDRVIVSKLTPGPIDLKRGDIIVFADPGQWLDEAPKAEQGPIATVVTDTLTFVGLLPDNSENHLIKRVIGLPGDHVVCCDEGGRITINGTAIKEPYLKPGDAASEQDFDITVPSGRVWVMGDHRSNSADSRAHDGPENNGSQGSVDERLIVGRAVALVWPLDHLTWLSNPTATFATVPAPSADSTTEPQGTGTDGEGQGGGEVGGTDSDTPTGSG
jgi:signal peptidase I